MAGSRKKKSHVEENDFMGDILQKMGCTAFMKAAQVWVDTKSYNCNKVIGSKKLGAAAGKMYEISGKKHSGKTSFVMFLAALAQRYLDAFVLWVDVENSLSNESDEEGVFYNAWAAKFDLNMESRNFYRVYPKVLIRSRQRKKGKKVIGNAGEHFLQSAEFLFEEAETVMKAFKTKYPKRPIFMAVDSIANLLTEMVTEDGNTNRNMRQNMDRSQWLSNETPKLLSYAGNYSAWVFLINQLRTNPTQQFGDNQYSPGGAALGHNCHSQVRMRARKLKRKRGEEELIGISGIMVNTKNKVGGGSRAYQECEYKVDFRKRGRKMWKFSPHVKEEKTNE